MKYQRSLFAAVFGSAVLLGAASFSLSCAGGPPLPMYAMPPPQDVKTLTFLLSQPRPGDEVIASAEDAIQSALIRAEYKITTDESEPHDAVIDLDISANEKQAGFMQVQVNGKVQKDYAVHVSLSVKEDGKIVDQKVYDYVASGGSTEGGHGYALINELSASPRFQTWAKQQVAKSAPPPAKPSATATAVAGNTKPKATTAPPTPPPTTTTPGGVLGTPPVPANTSGAAAGAASAGKGGAARDHLGTTGPTAPPAPSSGGSAPNGGTAPME